MRYTNRRILYLLYFTSLAEFRCCSRHSQLSTFRRTETGSAEVQHGQRMEKEAAFSSHTSVFFYYQNLRSRFGIERHQYIKSRIDQNLCVCVYTVCMCV